MAEQSSFCVFRNITIPALSLVTKAHIYFYSYDTRSGVGIDANIYFSDEDNAQPPADKTDLDGRSLTASVSWPSIEDWYDNKVYRTPDLKDILQEVLDRNGWAENNNVMAILKVIDGPDSGRFWSAEEYLGGIQKACLRVWWREAEQLQTPYISPFVEAQIHAFYCSIFVYPTDANIYYTLDGSDPDEGDTLYTAPFEITDDTVVKAKAYKDYWIPSEIATKNYTILEYAPCDNDKPAAELDMNRETVDEGSSISHWIGVDSNGVVHILYSISGYLYHRYGSYGSLSEAEEVYNDPFDDWPIINVIHGSFDVSNNLHAMCYAFDAFGGSHDWKTVYAKWDGSWSADDSSFPVVSIGNIAVDNTGAPCIGHNSTSDGVGYYRWNGSSWDWVVAIPKGETGPLSYYWIEKTSDGYLNMIGWGGVPLKVHHYSNSGGSWASVGSVTPSAIPAEPDWVGCTGSDFFVVTQDAYVIDYPTVTNQYDMYFQSNESGVWREWDGYQACIGGVYAGYGGYAVKGWVDGSMRCVLVPVRRIESGPSGIYDTPFYFEFIIGTEDDYSRYHYDYSSNPNFLVQGIRMAIDPRNGEIHLSVNTTDTLYHYVEQ